MQRRSFTKTALGSSIGVAIGSAVPAGWLKTVSANLAQQENAGQGSAGGLQDRVLVVIQLSGGNDGLNTVVPYRDERYRKARPELGISESEVIKLDDALGLHPAMRPVEHLLESQRWSIVQGVGYPSPNRSHFESMDIWHTCHSKKDRANSGWLGRWVADQKSADLSDSLAVHLGAETLPLACQERGVQVPSLASLEQMRLRSKVAATMSSESSPQSTSGGLLDFVSTSTQAAVQVSQRLENVLASPDSSGDFPGADWGEVRVVSRLILAGVRRGFITYLLMDSIPMRINPKAVCVVAGR